MNPGANGCGAGLRLLEKNLDKWWLILGLVVVVIAGGGLVLACVHNYLILGARSPEADEAWSLYYGTAIAYVGIPSVCLAPPLLARGIRKNREYHARTGKSRLHWELTIVLLIGTYAFAQSLTSEEFKRARALTAVPTAGCPPSKVAP
jgi:hypothetical protein